MQLRPDTTVVLTIVSGCARISDPMLMQVRGICKSSNSESSAPPSPQASAYDKEDKENPSWRRLAQLRGG